VPPRRCRRRWLGQRRRPLLLSEETCGFLPHDCSTLLSNIILVSTSNKALQKLLPSMDFEWIKLGKDG
jgi:hypothetical protein